MRAITGLEVGDVVRLLSGGPQMVISMIDAYSFTTTEPRVECQWFDVSGHRHSGIFNARTIMMLREKE